MFILTGATHKYLIFSELMAHYMEGYYLFVIDRGGETMRMNIVGSYLELQTEPTMTESC